ncbi:MAG TPA: hypothetical protein DDW52_17465, partial [Planctomycetaceae bacterium]|nr:hypothetical protein [Planctomycetaceae bacterium]
AWRTLERDFGVNILPQPSVARPDGIETTDQEDLGDSSSRRLPAVIHRGERLTTKIRATIRSDSASGFEGELAISRPFKQPKLSLLSSTFIAQLCIGTGILLVGTTRYWRQLRTVMRETEQWSTSLQPATHQTALSIKQLPIDSEVAPILNPVSKEVSENAANLHAANYRFGLVLDNLEDGVVAVNEQQQVLLLGGRIQQHIQVASENYLFRPLLEVIRVPQVTELVAQTLATGSKHEDVFESAVQNQTIRLSAHPMVLSNNSVGAILTTRDETLLKRIETVRRDFVANASHELKTPLAAIRAYAETLQLGALDDRDAAENFVSGIVSQADRIGGLIQGMLQLSRLESGAGLKFAPFEASDAIQPCLAASRAMAHSKDVHLTFAAPDPITLHSDVSGFQTIASNLLANAVRYTPAGGSVHASLEAIGENCVLVVEDTGVGIQPDDLERIFERFYRAEKDR